MTESVKVRRNEREKETKRQSKKKQKKKKRTERKHSRRREKTKFFKESTLALWNVLFEFLCSQTPPAILAWSHVL